MVDIDPVVMNACSKFMPKVMVQWNSKCGKYKIHGFLPLEEIVIVAIVLYVSGLRRIPIQTRGSKVHNCWGWRLRGNGKAKGMTTNAICRVIQHWANKCPFQSDPEQRFDFIFGDLTDTPIQVDESGDKCDANSNPDNVTWTFIKEVRGKILKLFFIKCNSTLPNRSWLAPSDYWNQVVATWLTVRVRARSVLSTTTRRWQPI